MGKKNYKATSIFAILGSLLLFGIIYYILLGNQIGVLVSCEDKEIESITNIPPPLMSIAPPPTSCLVDFKAYLDENVICSHDKYQISLQRNIIPCNELKKYLEGDLVTLEAIFYDSDGKEMIGQDTKKSNDLKK